MNLLRAAAEILQRKLEQHASETVAYERKGQPPLTFQAVLGRSVTDNDPGSGFIVRIVSQDFIIRAALLAPLDPPTPKRNDTITVTINGVISTFVVNGEASGAHYENADSFGVSYRVHTKLDRVDA